METADLFAQCDPDSKGWFGPGDLSRVCPQLSEDELRYVFDELDVNKDCKVSREEFMVGFEKVINQGEKAAGYKDLKRRASTLLSQPDLSVCGRLLKSAPSEVIYGSDPETTANKLDHLPCQKDVLALYEQLQNVGVPQVLSQFEKVIGTFSREIGEQKEQNERLQHIYANEKEYYNKRMLDVETELDQQITLTEQRARQEEREGLEKEKAEMRRRLEEEVSELRSNIKRVQRMETIISDKDHSERLVELKNRLQEMTGENRNLKSNLTQNQVEVAIIKAEMAQLRGDYEEKCVDLVAEKDNMNSMIHERDNLTRQLQLLYDANKKLHDTNDALRVAMESRNAICRQFNL